MQEETLRMPEGDSVRATEVEETMLLIVRTALGTNDRR